MTKKEYKRERARGSEREEKDEKRRKDSQANNRNEMFDDC